ncbi:hypothetical protein B0H13DRAFT_1898639 [Mycena leptocephala]|nr:hypothetical protein B0H13DRAFT_1898639 [Mycena leptocephala]
MSASCMRRSRKNEKTRRRRRRHCRPSHRRAIRVPEGDPGDIASPPRHLILGRQYISYVKFQIADPASSGEAEAAPAWDEGHFFRKECLNTASQQMRISGDFRLIPPHHTPKPGGKDFPIGRHGRRMEGYKKMALSGSSFSGSFQNVRHQYVSRRCDIHACLASAFTPNSIYSMRHAPLISWNEADGDDSDEVPDLVPDYPEVDFSPTMCPMTPIKLLAIDASFKTKPKSAEGIADFQRGERFVDIDFTFFNADVEYSPRYSVEYSSSCTEGVRAKL